MVDVSGLARGVSAISAGGSHTCALTSGGGVKCWGYNTYGQLGNGIDLDSSVPVDVAGLASGVTAIAVGWSHTCALTSGGGVKCWGDNHFGWLGDGTTTNRSVPVDVIGLASGVTAIATGTLHTCALKAGGGVTCWGFGQSDDPSIFTIHVPTDVPGLGTGVTAIDADLDRTCALANDAQVTCWGPNYAPASGESLPDRFVRVDVSQLAGGVAAIAAGEIHSCAVTGEGRAACWGNDGYGQLGRGVTSDSSLPIPVEVPGLGNGITGIAVGGRHTCALTTTGVRCWGANDHGQVGYVTQCSSSSVPVEVPFGTDGGTPPASSAPTLAPSGRLEHATGPTDVVLRYDVGPDVAVGELEGELFNPGPEFTLYGDGTVIFRDESAPLPPAEGPIVRAGPFTIGHLDDDQVQSLLRLALEDGGLAGACERYETQDTDGSGSLVFTVRAGGIVKRVDVGGPNPLRSSLRSDLRDFARANGIPTKVWVTDRYWGNLMEAASAIEIGLLPDPQDAGIAPWPWPDIAPGNFAGRDEGGWIGHPRRIMTADEAAVLRLSDSGGVVKRMYLLGPDRKTVYSFSLWPVSPEDPS